MQQQSVDSTPKKPSNRARKPENLDTARGQFAKLLRARIDERERELDSLRRELDSIGGSPSAPRRQACSGCGRSGHTKRTCSASASIPPAELS